METITNINQDVNSAERILRAMSERFQGQPCEICGRLSEAVYIFEPDDPQAYGAPENKFRIILFPICNVCAAADWITEIVPAMLQKPYVTEH